jgi:hypothetical protein
LKARILDQNRFMANTTGLQNPGLLMMAP